METVPGQTHQEPEPNPLAPWWGVGGAIAGGIAGYFLFFWIARQGVYAVALPGVLVGVGAAWPLKRRHVPLAIASGIAALLLGFYSEWRFAPFIKDDSLGYFLAHLGDLRPVTLVMLALGAFGGFWFPFTKR